MTDEPPISDRFSLIDALRRAADLEHDVVCRYLFAAFSLKTDRAEGGVTDLQLATIREWRTAIFRVAREEMGHLGLVCNLLTAVGSQAQFAPHRSRANDFEVPHGRSLRPFSADVLDSFVRIERDHDPAGGPGTIGSLYARIREGFERTAAGNPLLFVGSPAAQVDNASLDLPPGWFDFDLHLVTDVRSARRAVDQILEESGEASGHADVFAAVRSSFEAMRRDDPDVAPVRPVAAYPTLRGGDARIEHPVSRAAAALFNDAYELMLMMMLRFYAPAGETDEERRVLQATAFFPLMTMVLRPLGELLTRMPLCRASGSRVLQGQPLFEDASEIRGAPDEAVADAHAAPHEAVAKSHDASDEDISKSHDASDEAISVFCAGPTFECRSNVTLPPHPVAAWTLLQERLDGLAAQSRALAVQMRTEEEPWRRPLRPRCDFLSANAARLAADFRRQMNSEPEQVRHLLQRLRRR